MPPQLHLSDVRSKCFLYRCWNGKQNGTVNEWTNEGACLCRLLTDIGSLWIKKSLLNCNLLIIMRFISKILKLTWNRPRLHLPPSLRWNLWIYSLGVSTCLTSRQNRLTSIRIISRILLPCSSSNFVQNVIVYSVRGIDWLLPANFIDIPSVFLRSERNMFSTGRTTEQKPRRTRQIRNASGAAQAVQA